MRCLPYILSYIGDGTYDSHDHRETAQAFREDLALELVRRGIIQPQDVANSATPRLDYVHLKIVGAHRAETPEETARAVADAKVRYMYSTKTEVMVDDKFANCERSLAHGIVPYQVYRSHHREAFELPVEMRDELLGRFPDRFHGVVRHYSSPTIDDIARFIIHDRITGRLEAKMIVAQQRAERDGRCDPETRPSFNRLADCV